jgi:hypothetical protein
MARQRTASWSIQKRFSGRFTALRRMLSDDQAGFIRAALLTVDYKAD